MPRLRPFKALRYPAASGGVPSRRLIDDPLSAPESQRRLWSREDPLHPIHLAEAVNPESVLRRWRDDGALAQDAEPAFHVLEIQPAGERLTRRPPARYLLGALGPEEGLTPLEDEPRDIQGACAMPAVAADDHMVLRTLLNEVGARGPAEFEARSDGHLLRLWRVGSPTLHARILQALEEVLIRPLGPVPVGKPVLTALAPLSDPGLHFEPIHRALRGSVFDEEKFLTLVRDYARVYDLEAPLTTAAGLAEARERLATLAAGYHAVLLVLPRGRAKLLRFRQALDLAHIKAVPRNPTLRSLDLSLLNALVFQTVLGIHEPEKPGHPQVFGVPSLEGLIEQVDAGMYQAGFGLNPPPAWEIRAVMEARQSLPPRTLRLSPLPPAGLLFLSPEG